MNTVLCLVFLAFALVLSHQDVRKRGGLFSRSLQVTPESLTSEALANLVKEDVPISSKDFEISPSCGTDMNAKRHVYNDDTAGILYDYQTTCYVIGHPGLSIDVESKTETPRGPTALTQAFQAVFLPYNPDKNTYMILDPSVVRWFFTSMLNGCDMFVAKPKATAHIPGNRPIVIHSNLNKCKNNEENLRLKGNSVDQMINSHHPNYELIARVYCEPLPAEKLTADQYLNQYKIGHPGIKLVSYKLDPPAVRQFFFFVGYYLPERWTFILKGMTNGQLTPVINLA